MPDPPARPTGSAIDPIRPTHGVAHDGWTVLICRPDGTIDGDGEGLFDLDCRILSRHALTFDSRGSSPLAPVGSPLAEGSRWCGLLRAARLGGDATGPALPQDAWTLAVDRRVGPGMAERLTIENHSMVAGEASLTMELGADFADSLTRGRGSPELEVRTTWSTEPDGVLATATIEHDGRHETRGLRVRIVSEPAPKVQRLAHAGVRLRWQLELAPHESWTADLTFGSLVEGTWREPSDRPERAALCNAWTRSRTRLETVNAVVGPAFERAADDLLALRNWELEPVRDGSAWLPNAGVPWFTGLFGRDVLTAGWQAAMLGPELLRGALDVVAATQGARFDPFTEEAPGRMIHEMRRGPIATLGVRPHARYYGTQTTPSMFVLALSEAWHWTGDFDLLKRFGGAARRAVAWSEGLGDLDGDGFLEYDAHSPHGLKNQGWKDSNEAIRYPDGRLVDNPIATVEEQAFHYLALQRLAEILVALDESPDEVERLLQRAAALKAAWDAAFWLEDEGFYAIALDGEKVPVASIASNPIHALGTGIVPHDRAATIADRLLADDLFSGWGIRTLSSRHPSFNPLGYHLGTVWPVENATAMLGFKRYGLHGHVDRLAAALFGAIAHCRDLRLPEALAGFDRTVLERPIPYPSANSPQAWSASATIQLVQALLGLYPFAPAGILALVRPRLPAWLPELTVHGLRVGQATLSIRFERREDGSAAHHVLDQDGHLLVINAPPPDAVETGGPLEALSRLALAHAPGRLGRALRIALGLDEGRLS